MTIETAQKLEQLTGTRAQEILRQCGSLEDDHASQAMAVHEGPEGIFVAVLGYDDPVDLGDDIPMFV